MLIITELENGDLELKAENPEEVQEMIDNDNNSYWSIMASLFEEYSCNGSYTHFNAEDGNPFVGLTSAPCIAESMDVLDRGENVIVGRYWYFDKYVTTLETEELAKGNSLIYKLP